MEEETQSDYSHLKLRTGHNDRPFFVCGDGHIFLETFSPFFKEAYDFCIAIAEPVSRPKHIQEYKITPFSLYAAISVGLTCPEILAALRKLSKNELAPELVTDILNETAKCGKIKLVLRDGRYFVESPFQNCLRELLFCPDIAAAKTSEGIERRFAAKGERDAFSAGHESVFSFQIDAEKAESVKRGCRDSGWPSLEEYDFRADETAASLCARLRSDTNVRPYQQKSLGRMLGNGRARSGIIVLPCGAGKTLVGISAACTIGKSVIVLATTGVSCRQWKEQFLKWTDLGGNKVKLFVSSLKESIEGDEPCVLITTYSMLAFSQRRSKESQKMIESVRSREWGLLILDEVHVAPADMFRRCLNVAKSKCKLGLTATLLREDAKISDLSFLVGPKLFEADWLELQRQRYLATVRCVEIWCPLDPLFCRQYILQRSTNRRNLLQTMNPSKFRVCEHLIRLHEERGDKIMVFSDNIFSLKKYAVILGKPFIYGRTSEAERLATLKSLQEDDEMSTVFISKIGDCSIDLPDVNVVIQISSHFSSRRQEAQRLGRILRPKARSDASAHFYTLVSEDTDECVYAARRQRFLIDQGYMFEVKNGGGLEGGFFEDEKTKKGLLKEVMAVSEKLGSIESDIEDFEKTKTPKTKKGKKTKFKSEKMKKIKESILRRKRILEKHVSEQIK